MGTLRNCLTEDGSCNMRLHLVTLFMDNDNNNNKKKNSFMWSQAYIAKHKGRK